MKHLRPLLLPIIVGAFSLGVVFGATSPRAFLPVVATGQIPTTIVTLVHSDATFVSAANPPGTTRRLLSFIDRAHGNRLAVVEDVGDRVVDVTLPPLALQALAPSPAFIVPDSPKQADGFILIVGNTMYVYFTGRDADDPTGPFKLKRITMPIPPPASP